MARPFWDPGWGRSPCLEHFAGSLGKGKGNSIGFCLSELHFCGLQMWHIAFAQTHGLTTTSHRAPSNLKGSVEKVQTHHVPRRRENGNKFSELSGFLIIKSNTFFCLWILLYSSVALGITDLPLLTAKSLLYESSWVFCQYLKFSVYNKNSSPLAFLIYPGWFQHFHFYFLFLFVVPFFWSLDFEPSCIFSFPSIISSIWSIAISWLFPFS